MKIEKLIGNGYFYTYLYSNPPKDFMGYIAFHKAKQKFKPNEVALIIAIARTLFDKGLDMDEAYKRAVRLYKLEGPDLIFKINQKYLKLKSTEIIRKPRIEPLKTAHIQEQDRAMDFMELVARGFTDYLMFVIKERKGYIIVMEGFNIAYREVYKTKAEAEKANQLIGIPNITAIIPLPLKVFQILR